MGVSARLWNYIHNRRHSCRISNHPRSHRMMVPVSSLRFRRCPSAAARGTSAAPAAPVPPAQPYGQPVAPPPRPAVMRLRRVTAFPDSSATDEQQRDHRVGSVDRFVGHLPDRRGNCCPVFASKAKKEIDQSGGWQTGSDS